MRLGYDERMRILMILAFLLGAGCQKAEPQSTPSRPHEAARIKTLTHDTDLQAPKATGGVPLREAAEALDAESKPQ